MNASTSPFALLRMLESDCRSWGEFCSAPTPASMSASVGSTEPGVSRSTTVRAKTLEGR